jgi:hypothetical protein
MSPIFTCVKTYDLGVVIGSLVHCAPAGVFSNLNVTVGGGCFPSVSP